MKYIMAAFIALFPCAAQASVGYANITVVVNNDKAEIDVKPCHNTHAKHCRDGEMEVETDKNDKQPVQIRHNKDGSVEVDY